MKRSLTPFLLLACVATAAWSAETDEHELAEKDVPPAVLKTMKAAAADGTKLGEFESEKKDGKAVFTATFHNPAKVEMEITVLPDGTLVSVEKEDDGDQKGEQKGEHKGEHQDAAKKDGK